MSATQTITAPSMPVEAARVASTQLGYLKLPEDGSEPKFFPGTASAYRRNHDLRDVNITDVRGSESKFSLDTSGFRFMKHARGEQDIADTEKVKNNMYPEVIELLKKETGATRVFPFSHLIRLETWSKGVDASQGLSDTDLVPKTVPAHFVHIDHSYDGAPTVLEDNMSPEDVEKLNKTRWAIINIWRPVNHPVTREPLAVCDARSVAEEDLVHVWATIKSAPGNKYEDISRGAGFDTWHLNYSPNHRWYYMSEMAPDELLMIKIFDSKKDGTAKRTPHTAFYAPNEYGPPRNSIEVRCLVFWEDQSVE